MPGKVKVEVMTGPRSGLQESGQFIITTEEGTYYQSYDHVIAFVPKAKLMPDGTKVLIDKGWTRQRKNTCKYRERFLDEGKAKTKAKIASGEYELADLN